MHLNILLEELEGYKIFSFDEIIVDEHLNNEERDSSQQYNCPHDTDDLGGCPCYFYAHILEVSLFMFL